MNIYVIVREFESDSGNGWYPDSEVLDPHFYTSQARAEGVAAELRQEVLDAKHQRAFDKACDAVRHHNAGVGKHNYLVQGGYASGYRELMKLPRWEDVPAPEWDRNDDNYVVRTIEVKD